MDLPVYNSISPVIAMGDHSSIWSRNNTFEHLKLGSLKNEQKMLLWIIAGNKRFLQFLLRISYF